ncbi:hypothetical protein [Burkholderia sp. SIMBA_062]|uniref:hypothetical protein n=1 Tax=Burkholderia sp. SIMBA_062 TaxID=3085803 RepID=UPI00397819E5
MSTIVKRVPASVAKRGARAPYPTRRQTPEPPRCRYRTNPDNGSDAVALDTQRRVALARDAGMLVILDGQIGRERYESVTGSIATLARFAKALPLAVLEAA